MPVDENEEGLTFLDESDAAVQQLRDLSSVLEERLKTRQAPLSQLPAPPRPSAFTTEADRRLLSTSPSRHFANKPFPSAVDRLPGHTPHAYSFSRTSTSLAGEGGGALKPPPATADSTRSSTGPPPTAGSIGIRFSYMPRGQARSRSSSPDRSAWSPPKRPSALSLEIKDAAAACAAPRVRAQAAAASAATLGLDPYGEPLPLVLPTSKGSTARTHHSSSRNITPSTSPFIQQPAAQIWSAAVPTLAATQRPGQRKYVQLFHTAKSSRVGELSNFKKEMEDIDLEIKQYVSAFKYDLNLPDAALHLQTVWRARGPRLLLKRFTALRTHCLRRRTAQYFVPLLQLVRAPFHARHRLMHRCLEEWREIMSLKLDLYRKLIAKLKASMIDVRDSQSPNHLWRLCTAPGQDPWKANLNLGRLVSNIILSQAPWRKMKLYFHQWLNSVRAMLSQRQKGSDVLASMESKRSRERVHNAFRFWFRYAIVQVSERLQVDPPLFRPRMPEWEKWYYEHNRTRELEGRIEILHKDFRLRYCLQWWHLFTSRNIKMRKCWISAAADQIEGVMRHGMSAFKANWRYSKYRKLTRAAVFRAWLHITKRNVEVRKLALQVEKTTRRSIMAQCMRRLRQWQRASSLISTAATIHIWQRRTLALGPMCAWMGDGVQMLFVLTWQRWKQAAVSRIRFKTFLTGHLELQTRRSLDLSFKAWRKVTYQRVETRKLATKRATKQLSDLIKQERELGAENGGTLVKWSAMVRQSPKTVQRLSVQSVAAESSRPDTPGSTILSSVEPAHSTAINGMVPEGDRNASIADAVEPANVTTDAAGNNAPPSFVPHVVRTLAPFTEDVIEDDGLGSSVQQLLLDHWGDNYIVLPPLSESGERDIGELHLPPDVFTVTYEEVLEAAVKATVQAFDDDVEDIWVTAGDFPMNHNWRPLIGRVKMMQEHDVSTVGMSDMRIGKLLEHLLELDGPFTPGHNNKQLVLDVYRRIEVDMYQRVELAHGSTGKMWLEQPEPDPTIWQRLIGLRYTLLEPSPDFIGHFIDIRSVPLFEEVLPIKIFLMRERSSCSAPPELELEPSGATTTSSTSNRVAVAAFTTLKASSRFHGLAPLEAEASMYAEEKRIHARHAKDDAVMSEDDRTLMLLYKMGEAEQILETCLCAMLNLGFDMITPMYRVLKKKLTSSRLPPMLKGDYLVKVLKAAIVHDHNYMHANMLYRGNRDRVITMGVELQDKAWAVHYHRPEFTLTYPNVKPIRAVGEEGRGTHHDKSDEDSEEEQLKPFEGPAFKTASNAEGAAAAVDPASKLPRGAAGQVPMSPSKATAGVVPSTSLGAQAMPVTCVRTAAAKLPHALTIPAAPLAALNTFTPAPKALPAPSVSTISRSELIKLQLTTPNMTSPKAPPRSPPVMSPARQRLMARVRKDAWRPGGNRMARKDMSMSLSLGITTSCNGSMRYRSRNTSVSGAGNKSPGCSIPNSPTRFASPEHLGSPPLPPPSVSTRLAALKADIVGASGMDPGASPSRSAAALADTYAWFPGGRLFPSVQDVNLAETPTMMDIEHASGQLVRESLPVFFGLPMLPAVIFSTWGEPGGPAAVAAAAAAMAEEEAAALAEEELKLPEEPSGHSSEAPDSKALYVIAESSHDGSSVEPEDTQQGHTLLSETSQVHSIASESSKVHSSIAIETVKHNQSGLVSKEESRQSLTQEGSLSSLKSGQHSVYSDDHTLGSLDAAAAGAAAHRSFTVPGLRLDGILEAREHGTTLSDAEVADPHHGHGSKSVSDTPPSTYRSHLSDAIEGSGIYLTKAKGNEEVGQETDPSSNVAFAMSNMKERRELEEAGRQAAEFEEILRQEDLERTAADPEDALGEGVVDVEGLEGEEAENAFAAAAASTIMHSRSNRFAAGSHREQEELDDDGEEDVIIPIHLPDEKSAGSKAGCSDNVHISLSPEGSTNVVSETTKHGGEGGADPGQTEGASTTSRRTFAAFGRRTMVRTVPRNWRSEGEERPLFVPQAWQIEIFLGGHMRRKHRPQLSESDEEEEKKKKATEEVAKPVSGPQVNLRAFNVGKLIKTVSTRQRTMLDDYDLRAELQRLKGVAPLSSALISDQMRSEMDQLEALLDPANKTAVKNTRRRRKKRRESNTGSRMSGRTYLSALSETPLSRSGADSGQPSPAASPMSGSRGASPLSLQRKASSPAVESPRLMNQWQQWQRSPPMTPSSALAAIDVTMLSPHTSMVSPASYQQLIPPQQQVVLPTRSAESGGSSVSPWQLPEDPLRPQDNALSSGATSDLIFSEGPPSDGAIPVAFLAVSPPAMYSPMLPGSASSIKPGSAAIVAASSSPPAHAVTSDLVDPSVIFPDRPGTSDSITGMAYPDSLVSTSSAGGTREARSASASVSASASASRGPGSPQGLRSADVSSEPQELSRRQRALAELFPPRPAPTPDIVNVSSSMFAVGGGTDTQNKMRRASNLRTGGQPLQPLAASAFAVNISLSSAAAAIGGATAAADAATVLKSRPSSREAEGSGGGGGSGVDASLASIGVDLDLGPETLKELEALKAMWSCSMYSGGIFEGDDLALYTGEAVQQLIDQAEDDAWQQYDQGAERLVDDLASAFAKQDQQHDPAAAAAAGGSFVNNGSSVLMGADSAGVAAAAAEGAVRPTHQLMKALAVMEDHVAASLDPEQLTGLHLGSYSDALAELMTRLMVAPMATRFLFWKKVQSLTSLKQRLIEDKALEKQLKDIAWSVAFEAAPPPPTRGGTQGMPEPGPLLQRPLPATTTGIQHQRSPWEPKGSWVAPGGPAPLRSVKMKLQSRVELEGFSSKDGTSHGPGLPIPNPSKIASSSSSTEAAAAGNNGPSTVLMMTAEDAYELEAHSAHEQLQVRQQELIELRRRMQEANTAAEMYPGVWIETPTIDEEHEALEELARVTVALNADMLRRRYQNPVAIGAASTSLPSGRRGSAAAGWHRDTRPGARESFQDTTEPWVTVPRPLVQPQPQPRGAGMTVTTHGASRATVIATSANELTSMAGGLSGVGVAVARLKGLPPLYSEQSEGTAGAASGQGQGRPIRGGELLSLPLAPIVNPPVHPDAERQPGNIHMTLPVPEALLDRSIPRWTRPNALSSSASMELSQRTPPSPDRMARMLPPPNTKRRPLPTGSDAPPWGRALPLRSSVSPGGKRRHQEDDDGDDVSAGAHANDASRGYPDSTSHRFASALAGGGSPLMQTPSMQRQGSTNLNPSQLLAKKILGDNGGAAGS